MGVDDVGVAGSCRGSVGARCLDLGCGAGDVTLELAGRVGPDGRVTAVDMDVVQLDVTRERTDAAGLGNVDVVIADVYQYRSSESFDLVYCRNLLQHLSRPVEMLRSMWAAVRPGGAIVVEDCDFEGSFCYPPNDGFEFWLTRYQRVLRSYGGDPLSGRKLPARFAAAGIPPPQIGVVQRVDLTGDGKRCRCSPSKPLRRPWQTPGSRLSRRSPPRWTSFGCSRLMTPRCTARHDCSRPGPDIRHRAGSPATWTIAWLLSGTLDSAHWRPGNLGAV